MKTARAKRAEYEHRTALKEDFDKAKVQGLTFAKWAKTYLERYAKDKHSFQEDQRHVRGLSEFFGNLLLSQITRAHVEEFKQSRKGRLLSPEKPVSVATCNRELACLRHILRLAVEEGLRESIPLVKLYKEHGARDRILSEEEYQRLLEASSPHLRRLMLCAYETGMRAGEIKGLT